MELVTTVNNDKKTKIAEKLLFRERPSKFWKIRESQDYQKIVKM